MTDEYLYELRQGVTSLMRACYEVIGACNQIQYACTKLLPDGTHLNKAYEKIHENLETAKTFTPNKKQDKGDPLAELVASMSPQDREKLQASLEKK